MLQKKLKLIYITGSGHSGSTLTDLILGSHSSIESVGELNKLPEYVSPHSSRSDDRKFCTCGIHIEKCDYWNSILNQIDNPLAYEINNIDTFNRNNHELIKQILNFTGKSILVDSSKNFNRLKKLIESELFDITVIHLVRDVRAVAYSKLRKQKKLKEQFGAFYKQKLQKMNKKQKLYGFSPSVIQWLRSNVKNYKFLSQDQRIKYYILKYENLVTNPKQSISVLLDQLGLEFEEQQLNFSTVPHHNIAGNRMRQSENSEIALDEEYKSELNALQWWGATCLAYRGLQLFKYPLRRNQ
jgi:hypothetical protein